MKATKNVRLSDPIGIAMKDTIWSDDATAKMLASISKGRPALEAIDSMLVEQLGASYGKHNGATSQAGYLVTRRMKELGYQKGQTGGPRRLVCRAECCAVFEVAALSASVPGFEIVNAAA